MDIHALMSRCCPLHAANGSGRPKNHYRTLGFKTAHGHNLIPTTKFNILVRKSAIFFIFRAPRKINTTQ